MRRIGLSFWIMGGWLLSIGPSVGWAQEAISAEAQAALKQTDTQDLYEQQVAFMRLEMLREPATAPLIRPYLDHRRAETRAFSIRALVAVEGTQAIPVVLERLKKDRSPYVRVSAILALEPFRAHDPAILPAFVSALRDRSREVRIAAIDAVGQINDPQAREALRVRARRERDRDVQRVLNEVMSKRDG